MPMAITQFTHNLYIQEAESGTDIDVVYRNYFKGDLKKKLLLAAGKLNFAMANCRSSVPAHET